MDNDQKTPAKKPIPKRTIVTISVVLVVILAVTAIVYFNSRKTEITARTIVIEEILGDVSVTNDIGTAFASLNLGTRLSQGNTLTAGERSHAGLLLDSASIVKTDELTRVGVNKVSDKELALNVLYGAISVNAAKLDDGNIINIEAGNTVIGLRGTLFTVVYKDNVLNVPLFDGRLEITAKDGEYTLDKGYMLMVTDGLGVSDVAAIDIEVLDRFSLLTILENADALLADGLFTERDIERVRELLYGVTEDIAEVTEREPEPEPETELITYTVTFTDYNGDILKTETVNNELPATPPEEPVREGHIFSGWDTDYDNITSDLTITALYTANTYTITFADYNGRALKTETVEYDLNATPPENEPSREGFTFTGWDIAFDNVREDLTVTAVYGEVEVKEEVITAAFIDPAFLAAVREMVNKPTGDIYASDVAGISEVNVSGSHVNPGEIKTLAGIEYFTALTWLDCNNNQLTSLDVSKNTALTWLDCNNNQLTSLDVSKNTALTGLRCGRNQLTTLDVSKNTALENLWCYINQFTSLDVSKNTALTFLDCNGNQLTSLDVSKNTTLTGLDCGGNQLTTLDVSKNTALTALSCTRNQLTALDVSNNTALTYLYCWENQLTSLDVSKNTALTELYCWENQLTSLDVSKNTALTELIYDDGKVNVTGWPR